MGKTTIKWTGTVQDDGTILPGYSFNPWVGCSKVSDGCKFCYAEAMMDKRFGKAKWGPQGPRVRTSMSNWLLPFKWNKAAQKSGQRARVFCASLADVFEDRPELVRWRADMFAVINDTPWLDWMLLTKRPENVNRMVADYAGDAEWLSWSGMTPRYNVWIGTSIEDQASANKRIPELLKIPARVRFLSAEPLLGSISLYDVPGVMSWDIPSINWVIVGGESGPDARPMHPEWARDLRDECKAEDIAFNFKQHGEWIAKDQVATLSEEGEWRIRDEWIDVIGGSRGTWGCLNIDGLYLSETTPWNGRQNDPEDDREITVYKVGKEVAGDLLDGVDHNEYPVVERAEPGQVEPRPRPLLVFPLASGSGIADVRQPKQKPERTPKPKTAPPPVKSDGPDESVLFPVVRRVRREL